jgi:drug/metabolite transporter (DMT)-like permease
MPKKDKDAKLFVVMFFAMLAWGGSWTSAKLVAGSMASEILIFWRLLLSLVSFVPILFFIKKPMKPDKKAFAAIVAGSVMLVLYNKFSFNALGMGGFAGQGGVLVSTINPIFTYLFAVLLFRKSIGRREASGLILGFAGGMILLKIWELDAVKLFQSGNLYFLFAALTWALMTIVTQKPGNLHPFILSFYIYSISALMEFFLALPYGVFDVFKAGYAFWLNIIYLSVFATTFGTTAYFFASNKLGAGKASSFVFLVPTSAMLLSWAILGEKPGFFTITGGIVAISAVYLINAGSRDGAVLKKNGETGLDQA